MSVERIPFGAGSPHIPWFATFSCWVTKPAIPCNENKKAASFILETSTNKTKMSS